MTIRIVSCRIANLLLFFLVMGPPFTNDAQTTTAPGEIVEIGCHAYWRKTEKSQEERLDPKRDKNRKLYVEEGVRCAKNGVLKLIVYGQEVNLVEAKGWYTIPENTEGKEDNTGGRRHEELTGARTGGRGETVASSTGADTSAREEAMKRYAEIEASNKRIAEANEILARTFKAGNEALVAATALSQEKKTDEAVQKYAEAVAQYDEGLAADPEQPALLVNKAVALKARGVERFNATIGSTTLNDAGKSAGVQAAKDDFKAAAEAASKAVNMIKAQPVPTDPQEVARYNANKYAAMYTQAESMRLFVSKADPTQADAGLTAYKDYLAVEADPAKKAKAQLDLAQMLLDAGAADKALVEFRAILATQPDSPEANLGAGLALYASGDQARFQEAANYLQRFIDVAPDTNVSRSDAKAILTELKNAETAVPRKAKPAARKRPSRQDR